MEQSREFQKILNKEEKHIKFTIEDENKEKCLNFLDIKIKNNNARYEFDVCCKPTLTNQATFLNTTIFNYQHIQRISCRSDENLFWKKLEGGNRISDSCVLQKWI